MRKVTYRHDGQRGALHLLKPKLNFPFWSLPLDILSIEPRPLIMSKNKIVISWSPKSGCSHVVVWHFLKEALLQAANHYHAWPHKYRAEVYYQSEVYRRELAALREAGGTGYTLLKVTRDPTKRLVSIFRHVCRHSFMHDEFSRKLKLDAKHEGVSLADLRKYLEGEKLIAPTKINPHLCAQIHPIWDMSFDRIITLNMDQTELNPGLNVIEKELGLSETRFENFPKFDQLRKTHYAKAGSYSGDGPLEEHRFKPSETNEFPKDQLSKSSFLQQMAREFYAPDFGKVDSGDTAGRLFTA